MKFHRFAFSIVLLMMAAAAFAQSHDHQAAEKPAAAQTASQKAPLSATQQTFTQMKKLAGEWEGSVTLDQMLPGMKDNKLPSLHLTMRVTSRGNVLVHEFQEANTPLDPAKYDHPVTMIYVNDDQLNLIHYCDAGNRPQMIGKASPDGKKVEFDFTNLSGGNKYGHMHHAVFTFGDDNHHVQEWTFMLPGDTAVHARMELQRVKDSKTVASN